MYLVLPLLSMSDPSYHNICGLLQGFFKTSARCDVLISGVQDPELAADPYHFCDTFRDLTTK